MSSALAGESRPRMTARLGAAVACFVASACLVACGVSSARPPVMYATGQITAVEGRRIEADVGTNNGVVRGATLLVFDVLNELTDPRTGALVRVDLAPAGGFRVHDADMTRCVGQGPEGAPAPLPGQYVRVVHPEAVPTEGWTEDAATWWRAIRNRDAIVGTDRTLPFYRAKRKRNHAD